MAQYQSDSFEGMSNLPTNSHGGMLMSHRCAVLFPVAATLAAGDLLVLGRLPAGYTIEAVKSDSDVGLTFDVIQTDSLDKQTEKDELILVQGLNPNANQVDGTLTMKAIRSKGLDSDRFLVAKITTGGAVTAGQEMGVTFHYRYRQVTY